MKMGTGKLEVKYLKESGIVSIIVSEGDDEIKFTLSLKKYIEWVEDLRQKGEMWEELDK